MEALDLYLVWKGKQIRVQITENLQRDVNSSGAVGQEHVYILMILSSNLICCTLCLANGPLLICVICYLLPLPVSHKLLV